MTEAIAVHPGDTSQKAHPFACKMFVLQSLVQTASYTRVFLTNKAGYGGARLSHPGTWEAEAGASL